MKRRKQWLTIYNVFLSGILALLGFASCTTTGADEYGQPHARYEIKGKVENASKEKLPDIQIIIKELYPDQNQADYGEVTKTNSEGEFYYLDEWAWPKSKFRIIWNKDEKAKAYKPDSIDIDMGDLKNGNGSWYKGEAYKELTITVEEKAQEKPE